MEQSPSKPINIEASPPPKPEGVKSRVKEWTEKGRNWLAKLWGRTEEAPREVLKEVGDAPDIEEELVSSVDALSQPTAGNSDKEKTEIFSPLAKGEFLKGNMPTLSGEDATKFYEKAEEIYGPVIGSGKWCTVLDSGDNVAKLFNQPDHPYSYYEFVFMKRFGGKAGLPDFKGATVNGYGLEKINGRTLSSLINEATKGFTPDQYRERLGGVISREQAQQLLDNVAEYHRITQRVHGDLATSKGLENIILDEEEKIRIIDTEWEKIGTQTPQSELENLHSWLTNNFKIEGLNLPQTISDEAAEEGLRQFKEEVNDMIVRDSVFKNRVVGFKEDVDVPMVKISDSGDVLIGKHE